MGRKEPWFALNGTRVFSWYEIDQEQLEGWTGPEVITKRLTVQLKEHRQRDREPYVRRLATLHHKTMTIMALQVIGPVTWALMRPGSGGHCYGRRIMERNASSSRRAAS
jgi:hypothetical protein